MVRNLAVARTEKITFTYAHIYMMEYINEDITAMDSDGKGLLSPKTN